MHREALHRQCLRPFVGGTAKLSVVEVAPVDVNDCAFHPLLLKVQGPSLRPALRRLPEGRRVKNPVIGGVEKCSKNGWSAQGGCEKCWEKGLAGRLGLLQGLLLG